MRITVLVLGMLALALTAQAQAQATSSVSAPAPGAPAPQSSSVSMTPILSELDRLQAASTDTNTEISRLRIEKWKVDGGSKQQAQSNAQSIQRNLSSALPGMISAVRSSPQDLGAEFKLYRNLNALYDVMSSLTEAAGAFGPKSEYEGLSKHLEVFDTARRNIGDALEQLTTSTQSQLDQLRAQVRTLQTSAAAAPPKKTVVDDTEPAKKTSTTHKKKTTTPAASDAGNSGTATGSSATPAPH